MQLAGPPDVDVFDVRLQAQKSLQILHRHFLTVDVDVRYRRSVELFTLQMIQHKLDLQAGGLYPIDYTMLYSVGISIFVCVSRIVWS